MLCACDLGLQWAGTGWSVQTSRSLFTLTSLHPGTPYSIMVYGVDELNNGNYSEAFEWRSAPCATADSADIVIAAVSANQIARDEWLITWSDITAAALTDGFEYSVDDGPWTASQSTCFTSTGLQTGMNHFVNVRAKQKPFCPGMLTPRTRIFCIVPASFLLRHYFRSLRSIV